MWLAPRRWVKHARSDAFFFLLIFGAGSGAELEEDDESSDSAADSLSAGSLSKAVVPKQRELL